MVKSLLFDTLKRYVESLGGRAFKPVAVTTGEFGVLEGYRNSVVLVRAIF